MMIMAVDGTDTSTMTKRDLILFMQADSVTFLLKRGDDGGDNGVGGPVKSVEEAPKKKKKKSSDKAKSSKKKSEAICFDVDLLGFVCVRVCVCVCVCVCVYVCSSTWFNVMRRRAHSSLVDSRPPST
jgi:hypothetical protein